jgi:ABC-type Fe3+ transport system permease subunit
MRYLVRFCWSVSLLGFLFNLFTTYGNVQQILLLHIGETSFALSRGQYFFFFLSFFCVLNISLLLLGNSFSRLPGKWLPVPFAGYWASDKEKRSAANGFIVGWSWAAAATANYFMMYWMLVVENEFHFEGGTLSSIEWFYVPGCIMAISLIFPWLRFFIRNPNLLARQERD